MTTIKGEDRGQMTEDSKGLLKIDVLRANYGESLLLRPWATYSLLRNMRGTVFESAWQVVQRLGVVFPSPHEPSSYSMTYSKERR